MLKFNAGYCTMIIVKGKNRFKFYEDAVKPENLCLFQPYRCSRRDAEYKAGNADYFKRLFNSDGCLLGEMVF
jgi:hypothetical protein